MTPERLQLSRARGFRLPLGAKSVARPSSWGNPYRLAKPTEHYHLPTVVHTHRGYMTGPAWAGFNNEREAIEFAVTLFRGSIIAAIDRDPGVSEYYLGPLVGHDLACWCRIGDPCHADVLLELAANK